MSSSSQIRRSLRRLRASQLSLKLHRRETSSLPFFADMQTLPKILLDTTVYVDQLQGRLPLTIETMLDSANIWHSTISECEMGVLMGLLDPAHPRTAQAIEAIAGSMETRSFNRIVNPDRDVWREAGILAGLLARLQQYGKADQRRVLNDALIYISAAKAGLTVLTRNVADYDLLLQLAPHGQALFYKRDGD